MAGEETIEETGELREEANPWAKRWMEDIEVLGKEVEDAEEIVKRAGGSIRRLMEPENIQDLKNIDLNAMRGRHITARLWLGGGEEQASQEEEALRSEAHW
eukprot:8367420-Lingulodinium_polyedra.AAC.1